MSKIHRGKVKNLFTPDQLLLALDTFESNTQAAHHLSELLDVGVTRQNVEYWRRQREAGNPNHINQFSPTKANRQIIKERELRIPSANDFQSDVSIIDKEYTRILVMPDLHAPYNHTDALDFMKKVRDVFKPDLVVNLGDEVDNHAISFHDADPNLMSAGNELTSAKEQMEILHGIFPNMLICHSNHGSLHYRRAKAHGIPVEYLRTYREILFPDGGGEGWDWNYEHVVRTPLGPVAFKHQCSGSAALAAAHEGVNLVVGHAHSSFEMQYRASRQRLYWGVTSGCLVDRSALAFAYGKESATKPILGCTMIINGQPMLLPMVLGTDGRWTGEIM